MELLCAQKRKLLKKQQFISEWEERYRMTKKEKL